MSKAPKPSSRNHRRFDDDTDDSDYEYKEQEEVSDELMVDVQDEQSEISLADNAMEVEEDGHSGCKCETCGQTFPTKRILSNHIKSEHHVEETTEEVEPRLTRQEIRDNMIIIDENLYSCKLCNKRFKSKPGVLYHIPKCYEKSLKPKTTTLKIKFKFLTKEVQDTSKELYCNNCKCYIRTMIEKSFHSLLHQQKNPQSNPYMILPSCYYGSISVHPISKEMYLKSIESMALPVRQSDIKLKIQSEKFVLKPLQPAVHYHAKNSYSFNYISSSITSSHYIQIQLQESECSSHSHFENLMSCDNYKQYSNFSSEMLSQQYKICSMKPTTFQQPPLDSTDTSALVGLYLVATAPLYSSTTSPLESHLYKDSLLYIFGVYASLVIKPYMILPVSHPLTSLSSFPLNSILALSTSPSLAFFSCIQHHQFEIYSIPKGLVPSENEYPFYSLSPLIVIPSPSEDDFFTCYALHAKDPTIILLGTSQGNVYVYHLLEEFRYELLNIICVSPIQSLNCGIQTIKSNQFDPSICFLSTTYGNVYAIQLFKSPSILRQFDYPGNKHVKKILQFPNQPNSICLLAGSTTNIIHLETGRNFYPDHYSVPLTDMIINECNNYYLLSTADGMCLYKETSQLFNEKQKYKNTYFVPHSHLTLQTTRPSQQIMRLPPFVIHPQLPLAEEIRKGSEEEMQIINIQDELTIEKNCIQNTIVYSVVNSPSMQSPLIDMEGTYDYRQGWFSIHLGPILQSKQYVLMLSNTGIIYMKHL